MIECVSAFEDIRTTLFLHNQLGALALQLSNSTRDQCPPD